MFAKKLFVLLAVGTFCFAAWLLTPHLFDLAPVFAQNKSENTIEASTSNPAEKSKPVRTDDVSPEIKEKAVKLLIAVARETGQFAAPQNRVRGQIVAADLLWEHDEAAARALFQNTQSELQEILNSLALSSGQENADENENYSKRYMVGEMRREYLLGLAGHDPKAALVALESLRLQTPSKQEYDPLKDDELELQIASTVAKKDPQQAYALAAKSVNDAVTYNTMSTLTDLYKNNSELGAKLAGDILAKFKTSKIRSMGGGNANTAMLESNLATSGNTSTSGATNYTDLSQVAQFMTTAEQLNRQAGRGKDKKVPALTDGEMRELADFIGQSFSRQAGAEPWAIAAAMPLITKYSPPTAQSIRRRLTAQQSQLLDTYGNNTGNYSEEERKSKTADEIVAETDKLPLATDRDVRYADAVHKSLEQDELEKAADIAGKIKDKTAYAYIFEELKTTAPVIKARRGDISEVRQMLATIKDENEKATSLTELVIALAKKGETEAAGKLLEETNQFLPARLRRKPNLETTLKIAGAFVLVQPERGFTLFENSIAQMNDLIAAGLLIDEFYDYGAMDADEVLYDTMERQGVLHTSNAVATIKNLATIDFDRTVGLADKFSRPEIRTFVRLKIAEALLNPEAAEREKTMREQYQNDRTEE